MLFVVVSSLNNESLKGFPGFCWSDVSIVAVLSVDLIIVSFSTIFHSNVFSILCVSMSLNRNVIYFLRNNFDQHLCHDGAIWLPTTTRNWNLLII